MAATDKAAHAAACVLVVAIAGAGLGAADRFAFGGLSLDSTVADGRRLYPRSTIEERHITVAEADVRDSIRAIDLPGTGTNRRLHIFFERTTNRGPVYPSCGQVLTVLRRFYGAHTNMQEFDEERARNRRYIWSRPAEELSLLCFRLGRDAFSASDLTIAAR